MFEGLQSPLEVLFELSNLATNFGTPVCYTAPLFDTNLLTQNSNMLYESEYFLTFYTYRPSPVDLQELLKSSNVSEPFAQVSSSGKP